jgi:hypothetical protein
MAIMANPDPAAASAAPSASSSLSPAAAGAPPSPAEAPGAGATTAGSEAAQGLRGRLLGLAATESQRAESLAQQQRDFLRRDELLAKAMPACYLSLVDSLRAAVRAFNDSLAHVPDQPLAHISWYETPNIVLADPSGDGMRVRLARGQSSFELLLRLINRSGKADVPLIEGYGSIGRAQQRTDSMLRIEGWIENGKVIYWVSFDFKRRNIPLAELPERIVMAVASHNHTHLYRSYDETPAKSE